MRLESDLSGSHSWECWTTSKNPVSLIPTMIASGVLSMEFYGEFQYLSCISMDDTDWMSSAFIQPFVQPLIATTWFAIILISCLRHTGITTYLMIFLPLRSSRAMSNYIGKWFEDKKLVWLGVCCTDDKLSLFELRNHEDISIPLSFRSSSNWLKYPFHSITSRQK
jgi:hypothetical protein